MAISLAQRVINLLRGPEVGRIRFSFPDGTGTITVDRGMYHRVASAIERRRIGIFPATDPALIPPDAGATYDATMVDGGTIFIRAEKMWGRDLEGDLVHECTHAGFDVDKRDTLTALNDEAAAYVAEVLYYRMSNAPKSYWSGVSRAAAAPVVEALLHEYQAGNTPVPTVDPVTFNALRAVLPLRPIYQGTAVANGGRFIRNG